MHPGAEGGIRVHQPDPPAVTAPRHLVVGLRVGLEHTYAALRARVHAGRPALLYVGNAWAPRHVVLVMPPSGEQELDVYEPSVGRVVDLPRHAFVERRLAVAGWDVPWAAVWAESREQSVPG